MKWYNELRNNIINPNAKDAEEHRKAAESARRQAESFRHIKSEAIINEDMDAYADACQRIEFYEQRAALEDRKAAGAHAIPVADYVDAWETFARDYNDAMRKPLARLAKARKELAEVWLEIARYVAGGNREAQQIRDDLKGERYGTMNVVETLTPLVKPERSEIQRGEAPETAIAVKALNLDYGRRSNVNGILAGWNTNPNIEAESLEEIQAKTPRKPRPIFPYPVYLPETEEQKKDRRLRNNSNNPVGYVVTDGLSISYQEDPEFYERQEQQRHEEAMRRPARESHD